MRLSTGACKLLPLVVLLIAGCQSDTQTFEYKEVPRYDIRAFQYGSSLRNAFFSFDDEYLILSSDKGGYYNTYVVSVDGEGPKQVSFSEDCDVFEVAAFPTDYQSICTSQIGGAGLWHLFVRDEDRLTRDITPWENTRSVFYGWDDDRESFIFGCNRRDARYMDVCKMDIDTFGCEILFRNDSGLVFDLMSPDARYFAFHKVITDDNSDMYLYDRETAELKCLSPHTGEINFIPTTFNVGSDILFYLTDEDSEYLYVKSLDLASGKTEIVERADGDIENMYFSEGGIYRVVSIRAGVRTETRVYFTETGTRIELPPVEGGYIGQTVISGNEEWLAYYGVRSNASTDLFIYSLLDGEYRRLTYSMYDQVSSGDLVQAREVKFESFDGTDITGLLYRPWQLQEGQQAPAILMVDSALGGQSCMDYDPFVQILVNQGYLVLEVNIRGSRGFGKSFRRLNDRRHGQDDLADLLMARQYLGTLDFVDTNRVAVIGEGYGGYLALMALVVASESFVTAVEIGGVYDWSRALKRLPAWLEPYRNALYTELGDPVADKDYLTSISPLQLAGNILRPLASITWKYNPLTSRDESDDLVEIVRRKKLHVLYFPCTERTGLDVSRQSRFKQYKVLLDFLNWHVKGEQKGRR